LSVTRRLISALLALATAVPLAAQARDERKPWKSDTDPNLYVDSLDTMVTYDDQLAARDYDDGYAPDAYTQFEAALAPYGKWVDTRRLGRVWFPAAQEIGPDFVPYASHGRWALTEYGWTWLSERPWGWATFHYGRWAVIPGRGWCWIPGTLWSPAWVAWRQGRNYVAWAPLPPKGMSVGRPLGPRSPWSMTTAKTFGQPAMELVPRRVVPSLFAKTMALSNPRPVEEGAFTIQVNAGPRQQRCCGGKAPAPRRLLDIAADAAPRAAITPGLGAKLETRPWIRRGFLSQTPVCGWPAPGAPETGMCFAATSADGAGLPARR
jgi:hypothetical protein